MGILEHLDVLPIQFGYFEEIPDLLRDFIQFFQEVLYGLWGVPWLLSDSSW